MSFSSAVVTVKSYKCYQHPMMVAVYLCWQRMPQWTAPTISWSYEL